MNKPGLKRLRAGSEKTPKHVCANCECMRYNKCGCERATEGSSTQKRKRGVIYVK